MELVSTWLLLQQNVFKIIGLFHSAPSIAVNSGFLFYFHVNPGWIYPCHCVPYALGGINLRRFSVRSGKIRYLSSFPISLFPSESFSTLLCPRPFSSFFQSVFWRGYRRRLHLEALPTGGGFPRIVVWLTRKVGMGFFFLLQRTRGFVIVMMMKMMLMWCKRCDVPHNGVCCWMVIWWRAKMDLVPWEGRTSAGNYVGCRGWNTFRKPYHFLGKITGTRDGSFAQSFEIEYATFEITCASRAKFDVWEMWDCLRKISSRIWSWVFLLPHKLTVVAESVKVNKICHPFGNYPQYN